MLITNAIKHVKPYITMNVGDSKFIYSNKYNILVITTDQIFTIYKNGKLLGQVLHCGIHTESSYVRLESSTCWNSNMICGALRDAPHGIPFYQNESHISIFGFSVTQYMYDSCNNNLLIDLLYTLVIM